ncbi:MAG: type III-B CRISPR module RAMP protein Cmr1 [Candidatus Competibacter sp.]|nr:type III-B CRISPR module RAMP protein Cmr1 [Candidatus Competibacter sp.]
MGFKNPPACPEEQRHRLEAWVRQLESQPAAGRWAATYEVHLLTPIFGGGVVSGQPDPELPIRTREVLYQLRFWWRILKIAELQRRGVPDQPSQLRKEETELFGWRGEKRSRVHAVIERQATPRSQWMSTWVRRNDPDNDRRLNYALWSSLTRNKGCSCFRWDKPAFRWRLELVDSATGQGQQKRELKDALRWWASFGGLGARSRRGMGAVHAVRIMLTEGAERRVLLRPVEDEEATAVGCTLKISLERFDDPVAALKYGINKLYEFRQGDPEGRRRRYGRSNWPEPDAIRRLARHWGDGHAPSHLAGDWFPRAAFGLPIQFQFQGGIDDRGKHPERIKEAYDRDPIDPSDFEKEPTTTQLVPKNGDHVGDRLASPLILRPRIEADGRYRCVALRLPEPIAGLEGLTLSLKEMRPSHLRYPLYRAQDVRYWNPAQADQVPPIRRTGETDPLDAFLEFFSRP